MLTQALVKEFFDYHEGRLIRRSDNKNVETPSKKGPNKYYYVVWAWSKIWLSHRIIFLWHHGYLPKRIDHIDGCSLNNKIENLREVTQSQNLQNIRKKKTNTSGYKGVSWSKRRECWVAQITVDRKCRNLGGYQTKELAYEAYQAAAAKYHTTNPEAKNVP